jgi:CubicO group peptidase (beta-lactamase class C family)
MNRSRVLFLVASLVSATALTGCSKNDDSNNPSDVGTDAPSNVMTDGGSDGGTGEDSGNGGGEDTGNGGGDMTADVGPGPDLDSSALREAMEEAFADAPASLEGMTLVVHDENDARVIEITVGDFGPDRRVAIASASKLVSGLVLLHMIDEGALDADETTDSYFDWQDGEAQLITLDQLGGFTSGLPPHGPCRLNPGTTLQDCAATLGEEGLDATPGTRFDYGSSHLHVAGSMAEQATGESWADLFDRTIKQPLGLDDPGLRYYTLPRQEMGDDNPLVAGGLRATADEYMEILSVVYHQGNRPGDAELPSSLVARMYGNPYTAAEVGQSPMADQGYDYRYGFGTWLLCEGAVANCARVGSAGAFGFTPWVDRDAGYYAVLAMEMDLGGSQWAFPLSLELMPLIEDALP